MPEYILMSGKISQLVGGKRQRVRPGDRIELTEEQARNLNAALTLVERPRPKPRPKNTKARVLSVNVPSNSG